MASGVVIHIQAGAERRTEYFDGETIKVGASDECDLRLEPPDGHALAQAAGVWLELHRENGFYRAADFDKSLDLQRNDAPLVRRAKLRDGDEITVADAEFSLTFFPVSRNVALTAAADGATATNAPRFIQEAAIESAASPKRDDAKVFLREFVRELVSEVSWVTKAFIALVVVGTIAGVFYIGNLVASELQRTREVSEQQAAVISELKNELEKNRAQIGSLDENNKKLIDIVSLTPTLRNEYGNGVCLLVGTYDLVDKRTGKPLRYPDPATLPAVNQDEMPLPQPAPKPSEAGVAPSAQIEEIQPPLTTEGYGTPAKYDFVGTGFHVGGGYIVTNRHVVQPWKESEQIKVLADMSNGRARLTKLVVYFPGFPQPFPIKVRETSTGEDLAVASLDPNAVFPEIPVLPLDTDSDAARVGKTVVTMGYPNGPDRILAMVDDAEARTIQARYGQSLQTLVNHLAQTKKISPLTTQGAITDLETKRVVHDAKTAEGGSGAPLFGQNGRVIGVNFGVFTQNTAGNMAVPVRFVLPLLKRAGWKSPEEQQAQDAEAKNANANTKNSNTVASANAK